VKLVWTRRASTDRKEIREYIAQDNPAAAFALDELFSEKSSRLIEHPGLGRAVGSPVRASWSCIGTMSWPTIRPTIKCGYCASCTQPGNGCEC